MKKVLVVDDSKTIRTMCEWIYKGLEDEIYTADSASAARSMIQSISPDVVIVDYTLPDADSYEFVSSIKDKTHVIMMGGTYAAFSEDKAYASGAVAVLMKPFKTDTFFSTVDAAATASAPAAANAPVSFEAPAPVAAPAPVQMESPAVAPISAHMPQASSVPPIGGFSAPAAQQSSPNQVNPFAGARRFNFPTTNSTLSERPSSQEGTPAAPMSSALDLSSSPNHVSSTSSVRVDRATPKTPAPSVSPNVQAAAPEAAPQAAPQIDPAVLRAEVIAAVKSLLPAIVNSYLKKLIQAEVKPQLQTWVDTRVESLLKKLNQQ